MISLFFVFPSLSFMASLDPNQQQPPWVPLETKKDCSQGLCSIYCPQLCYIIFPPPPPSFSFNDDSNGGTTFSPLVIAIIGILASAFLLVSYYTIIAKYCGGFRRPRLHQDPTGLNENHIVDGEVEEEEDDEGNQSHRHDTWHVPRANGLDEALINKITVCKYKRGDGLVEGTDCSVCLSEFQEEETLRLLPKCSHAFHLQCIDTWLRSHSNCPLCRANIGLVSPLPAPPQLPSAPPIPLQSEISHPEAEGERSDVETVVVIQDFDEEVNYELDEEDTASKEPFQGQEENQSIVEILNDDDDDNDDNGGVESDIRRSAFYMDSSHLGRLSVADIVQMNMEDECMVATNNGLSVGSGSCSRDRGEKSRSRNLHCVKNPILMKRSVLNGRINVLPIQRKGRNSVLFIE